MAKIVEVAGDIKVGTPNMTGNKPKEAKIDKLFPEKSDKKENAFTLAIQKAYILGMAEGAKITSAQIVMQLKNSSKLNPQKQIISIKDWCMKNYKKQSEIIDGLTVKKNKETENKSSETQLEQATESTNNANTVEE